MKVCVVGGNGNIGYHVADQLLRMGHQVYCFNRSLSGNIPDGANLIKGSRHNREEFEYLIRKECFDAAIDMICFNREDALSSIRAFRGVSHFINCSSVATYGREFDFFPTKENCPLRPWTDYNQHYAIGKAQADEVFLDAYCTERFPVTLMMPTITYGPKMGLFRQIGNDLSWIDRVRKGKPIVVAGDGVSLHQFMYVEDAGRAFSLMLGEMNAVGEAYNLVPEQAISWEVYHKTLMQVVGRDVEMVGVPTKVLKKMQSTNLFQPSDIFWQNSFFSCEKLKSVLPQFKPRITLEAGMQLVLEVLDRENGIPTAELDGWEDRVLDDIKKAKSLHT